MSLEHDHSPEAIERRFARGPRINYLRDWVYGGIDGAVTTFAIVAGAIGAELSARVILILGAANLLADGFSMAAANYSGTRTENDDYERLRAMEERHIALDPEGEREEVRQLYHAKGFSGEDLSRMVALVTSRRRHWIDFMLSEEHGLSLAQRSPWKAGASTFAAFLVCGAVPLVPFVFDLSATAALATGMTALVFFMIGSVKSIWSTHSWWRSGAETLTIGMIAAGLAYVIGWALGTLI
jgi:vacuolar iron transporter family protein